MAGLDDFVFHDFRHVAISNLRKAGNSPTVIMKASGHKTMSMFIRYNLVEEEDKWVKGELADGPKNAAEVKKKAITQGMTEKEFRNAKKDAGVSSNKTDFDGGWDLSLSNPSHVP